MREPGLDVTARRVGALAVVAALGLLYVPVFARLYRIWTTDAYSVHGLLVPVFSAFLLLSERDRLRGLPARPDPFGAALLAVFGLAVLGIGLLIQSPGLQGLSVPPVAAGLVLAYRGRACLRAVWFPLVFLALMTPVPPWLVAGISPPLQAFAAHAAAAVLGILGVPAYQEGINITLPNVTLRVAEICNGLRFLMALLVLATAAAQVTQRTRRAKLILVASAIPLGLVANAARVTVIALAAHFWGREAATGVIHHAIGKAVWVVALLPLVALLLWLRRFPAPPPPDPPSGLSAPTAAAGGAEAPAPAATRMRRMLDAPG